MAEEFVEYIPPLSEEQIRYRISVLEDKRRKDHPFNSDKDKWTEADRIELFWLNNELSKTDNVPTADEMRPIWKKQEDGGRESLTQDDLKKIHAYNEALEKEKRKSRGGYR